MAAVIGLPRGRVAVQPHDGAWAAAFAAEAERLRSALGSCASHLEHVGSTAVPDLPAKPVIDLALGLPDLRDVTELTPRLRDLGYAAFGERDLPGDHFFALGAESRRTHYLHVVAWDGTRWKNFLRFRDRLRADARLRQAYGQLKSDLAVRHPSDRAAYQRGKEEFIVAALSAALP